MVVEWLFWRARGCDDGVWEWEWAWLWDRRAVAALREGGFEAAAAATRELVVEGSGAPLTIWSRDITAIVVEMNGAWVTCWRTCWSAAWLYRLWC